MNEDSEQVALLKKDSLISHPKSVVLCHISFNDCCLSQSPSGYFHEAKSLYTVLTENFREIGTDQARFFLSRQQRVWQVEFLQLGSMVPQPDNNTESSRLFHEIIPTYPTCECLLSEAYCWSLVSLVHVSIDTDYKPSVYLDGCVEQSYQSMMREQPPHSWEITWNYDEWLRSHMQP